MTTWGCLLVAFAPDGPTGNDDDDRKSYFMLSFHYIATTRMVFYQWRMLVFTWLYHMKRIYFHSFPLCWCTIWYEPSPPTHQNSHFPFSFLLLNSPPPLALSQDLSWGTSTTVCIFLQLPCLMAKIATLYCNRFLLTWGTLCAIAQVKKSLEATWNAVKTTEDGTRPENIG